MATSAVLDPALAAKVAQPFDPVPAPAATVGAAPAVAPAVTPAAAPTTAASPAAAAAVFPHFADGLEPHKVKTTTITPNADALTTALAGASGLTKAELPTAKSTAGTLMTESGAAGVTNLNQVAYEMATARRESHMGNWMNEFGGKSYFEQHYGSQTKKGKELGNTGPTDGADFHGRGLVQVTGRTNYTKWSDRLSKEHFSPDSGQNLDLVHHPDQAAQPDVAAAIAVEGMRDAGFTKYKLGDFVNDKQTDYLHARRVINGMDAAPEIAAQATKYQGILEQHSGDYADAIIKGQTKNLPMAHEAPPMTAPTLSDSMLDPTRIGSGATKFERADKLLSPNLGHFAPTTGASPKVTNLKTHVVP